MTQVTAIQERSAALRLSLDELVVINNALNEVVNGRGVPPDGAECLVEEIGSVIDRVRASRGPLIGQRRK